MGRYPLKTTKVALVNDCTLFIVSEIKKGNKNRFYYQKHNDSSCSLNDEICP